MHGNRVEDRVLRTSTALVECYNTNTSGGEALWSGLEQVLQIKRTVTNKRTGRITIDTSYAITPLSPERATPAQLLKAWKRVEAHVSEHDTPYSTITLLHLMLNAYDHTRQRLRIRHLPSIVYHLSSLPKS